MSDKKKVKKQRIVITVKRILSDEINSDEDKAETPDLVKK